MEPDFVTRFMEWLPKDRLVDLMNVEEALHEFGKCNNKTKEEADYVKSKVSKSGTGSMLLKCLFSSMALYFLLRKLKCFAFF